MTQALDVGWDAAVPDEPRWVEVRSILLSNTGHVIGTPTGGVVVDSDGELAGLVGQPDEATLRHARPHLVPGAELLVTRDGLAQARALLPDRHPARAILHLRADTALPPPDPRLEVVAVNEEMLATLPSQLASEVEGAEVAVVRRVGGSAVSACGAYSLTETLWDVGVDTLDVHRRQGHARACFFALVAHMAQMGMRPVWGVYEDNVASLSMARSLGFEPVDELWVMPLG
ncbi:hypothetical protein BH23ACT5_BH23ACT5_16260 [soil metagenome]